MELSSLDRGHFRALIIGAGQAGLAVTATGTGIAKATITTDILLNATGTWNNPHVPHVPGIETFRGRQLHTKDPRVLLVGYGSTTSTVGATRAGRRAGQAAVRYLESR